VPPARRECSAEPKPHQAASNDGSAIRICRLCYGDYVVRRCARQLSKDVEVEAVTGVLH